MKNDKPKVGELREIRYESGEIAKIGGKPVYLLLTRKLDEDIFEVSPVIEFQPEHAQGSDLVAIEPIQGTKLLLKTSFAWSFLILESNLGSSLGQWFENSRLAMKAYRKTLDTPSKTKKTAPEGFQFARELGAQEWKSQEEGKKLPEVLTSLVFMKIEFEGEVDAKILDEKMSEHEELAEIQRQIGIK